MEYNSPEEYIADVIKYLSLAKEAAAATDNFDEKLTALKAFDVAMSKKCIASEIELPVDAIIHALSFHGARKLLFFAAIAYEFGYEEQKPTIGTMLELYNCLYDDLSPSEMAALSYEDGALWDFGLLKKDTKQNTPRHKPLRLHEDAARFILSGELPQINGFEVFDAQNSPGVNLYGEARLSLSKLMDEDAIIHIIGKDGSGKRTLMKQLFCECKTPAVFFEGDKDCGHRAAFAVLLSKLTDSELCLCGLEGEEEWIEPVLKLKKRVFLLTRSECMVLKRTEYPIYRCELPLLSGAEKMELFETMFKL